MRLFRRLATGYEVGREDERCAVEVEAVITEVRPLENNMDRDAGNASTKAPEPISGLHVEGGSEKHHRGETNGDRKVSKEQKASDNVDVVDARKRIDNDDHSKQIGGEGSDVEIVQWNKVDSNKTTGKHEDADFGISMSFRSGNEDQARYLCWLVDTLQSISFSTRD